MAGLGRKVFTAGDVLTASDVQNYLMDQTTMVFAGTAARSSAIATPTEGMFAVTTDNDELDYYNGSSWVPALPVGAWTTWAPTLSNGWSNGNGTYVARYVQIGKTVHAKCQFTFGSTTGKGAGSITLDLPVNTTGTNYITPVRAIAGGAASVMIARNTGTNTLVLEAQAANTTYVTNSPSSSAIPATWTTGDIFVFQLSYEAA